ncbi:MAG: helix-turn-helix domain-containing protein [Spirochaetota bacterium]|nr:helix-turn-helix domain-containing protein [Treponema sp.]
MKYSISTTHQLAHTLRSVRKSYGLSQIDTGNRVGLLPKTISALENHPDTVTLDSFFKLLSALDLELSIESKKNKNDSGTNKNAASEE